jgi:hypothetical protein
LEYSARRCANYKQEHYLIENKENPTGIRNKLIAHAKNLKEGLFMKIV